MTKLYEPSTEADGGYRLTGRMKASIAVISERWYRRCSGSLERAVIQASASANLHPTSLNGRPTRAWCGRQAYGEPSEFEDLQRRTVPWLTVDAASSSR